MNEKTHYRKAFNSPYLSSADIVNPITLTVKYCALEQDHSKKTKDYLNTIYFVEQEIRKGEKLKPMIANATNSKMMKEISGSPYIDDWAGCKITVYVKNNIKFGRDTVDGLRISKPTERKQLQPNTPAWNNAIAAYQRDGNLDKVLQRVDISDEHQQQLISEADNVS